MWKYIDGTDCKYEISDSGEIRNAVTKQTRKPRKNPYGYLQVNLPIRGKTETVTVHKLVARAYIPNPDNLGCVNHKDENKGNNAAGNLEWCGVAYNNHYGTRQVRCDIGRSKSIIASKDGIDVMQFISAKLAADVLGVDPSSIYQALNGVNFHHTAKGYSWRYADEGRATHAGKTTVA